MGINISQLALDTAVVTVEFQGHLADVTYKPNVLTTGMLQKMAARYEENDLEAANEFLIQIITDWEIYRGDKKLQISQEAISSLPVIMLKAIMMAIMEDTNAGEPVGT